MLGKWLHFYEFSPVRRRMLLGSGAFLLAGASSWWGYRWVAASSLSLQEKARVILKAVPLSLTDASYAKRLREQYPDLTIEETLQRLTAGWPEGALRWESIVRRQLRRQIQAELTSGSIVEFGDWYYAPSEIHIMLLHEWMKRNAG